MEIELPAQRDAGGPFIPGKLLEQKRSNAATADSASEAAAGSASPRSPIQLMQGGIQFTFLFVFSLQPIVFRHLPIKSMNQFPTCTKRIRDRRQLISSVARSHILYRLLSEAMMFLCLFGHSSWFASSSSQCRGRPLKRPLSLDKIKKNCQRKSWCVFMEMIAPEKKMLDHLTPTIAFNESMVPVPLIEKPVL
ncbi:unnamed protein product [Dovyalis caffra]|uniref:Uncharacterized protein n=1 Tax=Dovyalis caffra TaxID=77055 RepID=A0AAV1SXA8_9ROSI|nr:unnamed protein product [Dovyalis caffra]